jgi:phosphohistidine swiveling domain-containing protein
MLISVKSTDSFAKRRAGGKGYHLYLLSRRGFPVPSWVVVGSDVFQKFRKAAVLDERIVSELSILSKSSSNEEIERVSSKLMALIVGAKYPAELEAEIKRAYGELGSQMVSVRSSGIDEDSSQHSFAGQFSTFLYVESESDVLTRVKECWASAYEARGLSYRIQNGLEYKKPIDIAVVIQKMIDSEKSGVLFTCDPINSDPSKFTINSVYGVGEGIVSGLLDADTYLLERVKGEVLSETLVTKKTKLTKDPATKETKELPVPAALQDQSSLSREELRKLWELGRDVERYYRHPQDIEWAVEGGRLYILQARPVTTALQDQTGMLRIWDNSNIIESYGGITLPLTFTFAHFVYHSVYVQFCEVLLIPKREIQKMDHFLKDMIGSFYGRVYYNLLNWYKLTSILPGFKYNRSFMETMMGTSQSLADEIADQIKPPGFQEKFSSKIRRMISGFKFLYFHFTAQDLVDRFLEYFYSVYNEYRKLDFSTMTPNEMHRTYLDLEQRVLLHWKAPIINDYLCMVHFGLFKKLTAAWLSQLGPSLQNDLLCGDGNLESAQPTRELIRIAGMAYSNPGLKELLEETPNEDCLEALNQSEYREFYERVDSYIDRFGFRCMSEMKLEQKDLHMDPSFLFACIKNYFRSGQVDLAQYEKREQEIRRQAEAKMLANINGWKKAVYLWSLANARKAVRNRENLRFCRTRIYGVVRKLFYAIGHDYTRRGLIDRAEDIFYLTMPEMWSTMEGTLANQNIRAQIELRKEEYAKYETMDPVPRFMTRGPVYWNNSHFGEKEAAADVQDTNLPANCLKGTGCCPGVVEGKVKIIMNPKDNMELNGEILVTMRTDPGWIPLYPAASGLLVERGGLLSHSAIVAREMGLPTVVGVKGLTQKLKSGMRIKFDGQTGLIEILDEAGKVISE